MFDVLVVEDNDVVARQLARCVSENRWLRLAGTAATERQAIDLARRVNPDLVLLDLGLSTPMAGFDVWHALHRFEKIPDVIAVTAADDISTVDKARKYGVFGYVVKPYTSATIRDKLAHYISFRRSMTALPPRLTQAIIDKILAMLRQSRVLPSGLQRETLERFVPVLVTADQPLLVSQIADLVGLDRATANRYLNYLYEQGVADRVHKYGDPGPPPYLYFLAAAWTDEPEAPAQPPVRP